MLKESGMLYMPKEDTEHPFREELRLVIDPTIQKVGEVATEKIAEVLGNYAEHTAHITPERLSKEYERITGALKATSTTLAEQSMRRNCPEGIIFERNEHKVTPMEILRQGVELYRELHPEIEIHWEPSTERESVARIAKVLNTVEPMGELLRDLQGEHFLTLRKFLKENPNSTNLRIMIEAMKSPNTQVYATAHLNRRVKRSMHDATIGISWATAADEEKIWEQSAEGQLAQRIIARAGWEDRPIKMADILCMALEQTEGDLKKAIFLSASSTHIITRRPNPKFLPRKTDYEEQTMVPNDSAVDYEAVAKIFQDELGATVTWHQLANPETPDKRALSPEKLYKKVIGGEKGKDVYYDFSLPNQLGKIYHMFNLWALLEDADPEVLGIMTAGEYLNYGHEHGVYKLSFDLEVLGELPEVLTYLQSFSRQE